MKKILVSIIFFYILVLVQTSFIVHFDISGVSLNLILIAVILINFFERAERRRGLMVAAIGGFYLDLFSNLQVGVSILILFVLALLIKRALKRFKEENILYFIPIFVLTMALYSFFTFLLMSGLKLSFPPLYFNKLKLLETGYNLIVGIIGFYLIKICFGRILKR
jgi:rod shape-determining protein MreD